MIKTVEDFIRSFITSTNDIPVRKPASLDAEQCGATGYTITQRGDDTAARARARCRGSCCCEQRADWYYWFTPARVLQRGPSAESARPLQTHGADLGPVGRVGHVDRLLKELGELGRAGRVVLELGNHRS